MLIVILFITLALLCCAVAAFNGGTEGRWAAFMVIAAVGIGRAVGSIDLALATSPQFKLFVDGALLAGFYVLALNSQRYWPIWITGLQMNGVLAHLTTWLVPDYTPAIYRALQSFWGVPIVLIMAWGATADRRAGILSRHSLRWRRRLHERT